MEVDVVIDTQRQILLWCPGCGRPHRESFSLFDAELSVPRSFSCTCGRSVGAVRRGRPEWILDVVCQACRASHHLTFESRTLAHAQVVSLTCPASQTELGVVGEEALVVSLEAAIEELSADGARFSACRNG